MANEEIGGMTAACAHLSVRYATATLSGGLTQGCWACQECSTRFIPEAELARLAPQPAPTDWRCQNCKRLECGCMGKPTICPDCGWNKWEQVEQAQPAPGPQDLELLVLQLAACQCEGADSRGCQIHLDDVEARKVVVMKTLRQFFPAPSPQREAKLNSSDTSQAPCICNDPDFGHAICPRHGDKKPATPATLGTAGVAPGAGQSRHDWQFLADTTAKCRRCGLHVPAASAPFHLHNCTPKPELPILEPMMTCDDDSRAPEHSGMDADEKTEGMQVQAVTPSASAGAGQSVEPPRDWLVCNYTGRPCLDPSQVCHCENCQQEARALRASPSTNAEKS